MRRDHLEGDSLDATLAGQVDQNIVDLIGGFLVLTKHTSRVWLTCEPAMRRRERRQSRAVREVGPMKTALFAAGIGTAIVFAAVAPGAVAQEVLKFSCQAVGGSGAPEPLGDREGHNI